MWSNQGGWQGQGWGRSVTAAASATTWNPADKSSLITLTGPANLVWTCGNNWANVRSIATLVSNQKVYFEQVATNITFANWIGVADSSADLTAPFAGASLSPAHAAVLGSSGAFRDGDSANDGAIAAAYLTGDNIGVAFNSATLKIWFRKNGGSWNAGTAGTQDPATSQGGFTVSIVGSPFFALGGGGDTGDSGTAKFSSSDWTYAAPSGFTQLAA